VNFPVDLSGMSQSLITGLASAGIRHEADLRKNSVRRKIKYKATGWIEYDEFYPRLSKPICDEVDLLLAEHYGFTREELDFVLNYDIKYRLGVEANGDGLRDLLHQLDC
jgi:hypothetical protein